MLSQRWKYLPSSPGYAENRGSGGIDFRLALGGAVHLPCIAGFREPHTHRDSWMRFYELVR